MSTLLDNTSSLKAPVPRWKAHAKATNPRAVTFKLNISHPLKGSGGSLNPFSRVSRAHCLPRSLTLSQISPGPPLISLHLFSELSPASRTQPGTRVPSKEGAPRTAFSGFIKLKICYTIPPPPPLGERYVSASNVYTSCANLIGLFPKKLAGIFHILRKQ